MWDPAYDAGGYELRSLASVAEITIPNPKPEPKPKPKPKIDPTTPPTPKPKPKSNPNGAQIMYHVMSLAWPHEQIQPLPLLA